MRTRKLKQKSRRIYACAARMDFDQLLFSDDDEAVVKPIRNRRDSVIIDTFEDDDLEIPVLKEYDGPLNRRLKEIDIKACGGRYSSKDQVPKDRDFFRKITKATGIEDRLELAFALPRQLSSIDGDWLCPGQLCKHRAPKIENLYAHIATSKEDHENLKPVIRQSFCRPCRQFCKNPAGVLAHEMSHSIESEGYERQRLNRLLRINDTEEADYRAISTRKKPRQGHDSGLETVSESVAVAATITEKRKRSTGPTRETHRKKRALPHRNARTNACPIPNTNWPPGKLDQRRNANQSPELYGGEHSKSESDFSDRTATSDKSETPSDGALSDFWTFAGSEEHRLSTSTASLPSNDIELTAFLDDLKRLDSNSTSAAELEDHCIDRGSAITTTEQQVRNILDETRPSPDRGFLSPGFGPAPNEPDPISLDHGPLLEPETIPGSYFEDLLNPLIEHLADENVPSQGYGDFADFEQPALPSYTSTFDSEALWSESWIPRFEYPENVQQEDPMPWRTTDGGCMTLPSFVQDLEGNDGFDQGLLFPLCEEDTRFRLECPDNEEPGQPYKGQESEFYGPDYPWYSVDAWWKQVGGNYDGTLEWPE